MGSIRLDEAVTLGTATAGALALAVLPVIPAVSLLACLAGVLVLAREA